MTSSREDLDADVARWQPVLARARCDRLHLPIRGARAYVAIARDGNGWRLDEYGENDLENEIRLLETPDLSWEDVERLLGEQMVCLPMVGGRAVTVTSAGFEPNTVVGGLDRLLRLGTQTARELQLRAAGTLAAFHHLAIEVRP